MRTYFRSLSDVLGSPLAQTAQTFSPRHAGGHRVLKLNQTGGRGIPGPAPG